MNTDFDMKMYKEANEMSTFPINDEEGNTQRELTELDMMLLNIMRVGANRWNVLSAYKARKKCFRLLKKQTGRKDTSEYVNGLMLDFYPEEFKKAELGQSYVIYLSIFIVVDIVLFYLMGSIDYITSLGMILGGVSVVLFVFSLAKLVSIWKSIRNKSKR